MITHGGQDERRSQVKGIPMELSKMFSRTVRSGFLLTATSLLGIPMTGGEAFGQFDRPTTPPLLQTPTFNLNDLPLEEGEQIISSTIDGETIEFEGKPYRTFDPNQASTMDSLGLSHGDPSYSPQGVMARGCSTGRCGTCRSCGTGRGIGGGVLSAVDLGGRPRVGMGGDVCGPVCNPYRYWAADALYMKNGNVNNSRLPGYFGLSDPDFELGARITYGAVPNCREGFEFSFVGLLEWETQALRTDPAAGIISNLLPGDPLLLPSELTSFFGADAQFQSLESSFWSFEANRTLIGWDVVKILYGARYIDYQEDFLFVSSRPAADGVAPGVLRSSTDNRMLGAQIGIDMTYPLTCRLWSDARARAGAYINFAENNFQFINDADTRIFNSDDRARLAGVLELGGGLRYYLTNNLFLRGGGELWYMTQVASALDQFGVTMSPSTGSRVDVRDDLFLFGVYVGAEWRF
ncbi:MAG: hypothetical protein EA381_10245 [Planctomycetaceae bacterium]|nr:MAG: hypothetical protein EA381_10245 [Planctomycetaceae bacterium]